MEKFKSGFVSIIGKTNVGKSTMLNAIIGEQVSITTSKPQTTRTAIKGIINTEKSQIIFIDTPGIHKVKNKFGEAMTNIAYEALGEVDVILFLIEATYKEIGTADKIILEKLKEKNKKVILVINKIDLVPKENLLNLIDMYRKEYDFRAIVPISAIKKKELSTLINEIEKLLPEGPAYYNIDEYTDQTERQIVEEVVREKCLKLLNDEVPHGIYVKVEKMKLRKTTKGEDIYDIDIIIYCIRNSHKGIIIGKDGSMLKRIASYSRQKIEAMLGIKINMNIWVKVQEDWQNKDSIIKGFQNS